MAPKRKKSKFASKKILIPVVAISIIAVALAFTTIIALTEINPLYNANDFGVPELSIQDQNNNDEINDMINDAVGLPLELCALSPAELDEIEQCEELVKDENFVDIDPDDVDPSLIITCGLTQSQFDECTSEISEIIKDLQSQLIESQTPMNETEFSDDSPGEQLCDLTECPEASSVTLEAKITKVTSTGERIPTITTFDLPRQAFLVEEETNIDFRTGSLEIELIARTDPNVRLSGSGEFDILIGGNSIFTSPLFVSVPESNNTEGVVKLLIAGTDLITFSFDSQFDSFVDKQITPIEIKIITIKMSDVRNEYFNEDLTLFSMNIARDDLFILIQDEEGNNVRSFPMDSRVVVHSSASKSEPYQLCTTRIETWSSIFQGNGRGCSVHSIVSTSKGGCGAFTTAQVPAPSISASIADSDGITLASDSGSGKSLLDFDMLTRNATYTISATQQSPAQLDYGEAQETKSFTCTQEGTAILGSGTSISGTVKSCSTYYRITSQSFSGLTLGAISCNFP